MVCSLKNLINSVFQIIFNTYEHNRLKTVTDRKGKVVETYTYNTYGEVASVTDALGNVTTYEYDNTGRLTNVVMKAKDADKAASTTAYGYDKAGNILTQTDGNGNVTKYEYSAHGRLMSVTNADGNAESYVYDAFGNVTEKTDGNGTVVLYQYDNRNNLTQVSYDDKIIAYSYDKMNNRTSMDDESGEYAYTYDNGNRLVSVTKDDAAYLNYTYDKLNNVTSINHLTYTYDACGRMTSANDVAYTYDKNGNLATTTYPTGSTTYTYDANNRVTNVANSCNDDVLSYAYTYYDNGMEKSKDDGTKLIEYAYDGAGRLKTVTETDKATETVTRTATYTYDNAGNRESLVEVCTGTDTVNGESIAFEQKRTGYLYNEANVITLEREIYQDAAGNELASKNTRYVYDNAGNLISTTVEYVTEIPEEATEDATEAIEVAEDATEESTDDINIGTAVWIEVTINEYNGLNQLIGYTSIKGAERSYSSYVYNGDNLRTQKTVDGKVTDYVLNGGYVMAETGKTYLLGLSYHGYASAEATYWYFANSHGDITRVVDSNNATVAKYDYDEFGELTFEDGQIDNDILYAGEFYDRESENYYLRARYYNPSIGRFNSKDPHWNPSNMIYGDIAENAPAPEIRSANYTSYVPEPLKRNEMTMPTYDKGQDKVKSLIAETMAFSGTIYNGSLYESYFTGFGTPQEEMLFAVINARRADNGAILQSANLYVYCTNNPVMFVDPSGFVALRVFNYERLSKKSQIMIGVANWHRMKNNITQQQYETALIKYGAEFNSAIVSSTDTYWNEGDIPIRVNCYAYAFNMTFDPTTSELMQTYEFIQPGQVLNKDEDLDFTIETYNSEDELKNAYINAVTKDASNMNYYFVNTATATQQPDETWKIYFVANEYGGFHFFRQNSDGSWTHKQGQGNVEYTDDPKETARNLGYNVEIGYFYVGPKPDYSLPGLSKEALQ